MTRKFPWFCSALLLLLLAGAAQADLDEDIDEASAAVETNVIGWRRDIHKHPELSNHEVRTAALVAAYLKTLDIEVTTGVAHTGVVGILRGGKPGPHARKDRVVALRADMDALPVVEETGLPYASTATAQYLGQDVGVMHACGHDNHVAVLMGVAKVLSSVRAQLPGTVKFIFQPAEEGAPPGEEGGAKMMVDEGVLKNPDVDAVFGLHVMQLDRTGQVSMRPLGAMASSQRFEIVVKGRQTHGAMPWSGIDPIVIASQIVVALQTIVSRRVDITSSPAVVTVGTFQSGVRNNIIPDDAKLTGTIRTFDPEVTKSVHEQISKIATGIAQSQGAEATLSISEGTPATINDPALLTQMRPTLVRIYGDANVLTSRPLMAAEDFSIYQQHVPGLFFFVGVRPPDVPEDAAIPNHSPKFFADESALKDAVRAMASLAADYLDQPQ
jgi:amidohydrolase